MTWNTILLGINDALAVILVLRLFRLRLHHVYLIFSVFVLLDVSAATLFELNAKKWFDYRTLFVTVDVLTWLTTFSMVYALLDALLARLPGILRFSRYLLNIAFIVTIGVALLLANNALGAAHLAFDGTIRTWVLIIFELERFVSAAALVLFVAMLAFVSWFPVELPRNLAFLSFAFVAYYSVETAVLLFHKFVSNSSARLMSTLDLVALMACFAFLIVKLKRDGEHATVRIGHRWEKQQQLELISRLETVNQALVRSARQV